MPRTRPTSDSAALCDVACIHPEAVRDARARVISPEDAADLVTIFGVLADPTRVRLLHALSLRELCVCDLANVLGVRQAAASHQLRMLRNLRVVRFRKVGQTVYYSLTDGPIAPLLRQGLAHTGVLDDETAADEAAS